jgi:hypothetical protein
MRIEQAGILILGRLSGPIRSRYHQWRADEDDWSDQEDAEPILEREL